ncbi:MAG: HAD-IC family P-type ATPase, partial [Pseudomonadota bacterium]
QGICGSNLVSAQSVQEIPGKGMQGTINGFHVKLGSQKWCQSVIDENEAGLELWLSVKGLPPVRFTFRDSLRDDAKKVIAALHDAGIKTLLLSGDRKISVASVAKQVGIDDYHAQMTPLEKSTMLEELKAQGHHVVMVGDGLNDAPCMASADVSISPASAVDITQNTADLVFQGDGLSPILHAWHTAKQANILVKQNFILAVCYNIVAIPLAVLGHVTPLLAALAMSGSSLLVIGNSFRLRRKKDS